MKHILASALLIMGFMGAAQTVVPCYTDEVQDYLLEQNPALAERYAEADALIAEGRAGQLEQRGSSVVRVIPVVVHVMYASPQDNISKAQIEDAIAVLNEDFRRQNADAVNTRAIFQGVAADVEVEFRLATKDPQGNCTDGITRTQTALAVAGNDNVKSLIAWDRTKYLNIWTIRNINLPNGPTQGIVLGYAYRPFPGQSYPFDGVVMRHDRMGRIGTSNGAGRTLTHEVGHYLGLAHTFDDGCFAGDNCADTPPAANPNYGCPITTNSCSNDSPNLPDMIENYMDYADDNCMNAFTLDQKSIMQSVLTTANLRANLVSPSNATATGINVAQAPLCTPKADFRADARLACTNEPVQFSDLSWNGAPSQWNWSFPGATPSSSTDPNPVVTYAAPGDYSVTLTASNATGSNSVTKTQVITIRPSATPFVNQVVQDFETWSAPDLYWTSIDQSDGITFATTSTTGYNSSKSLRLNNHAVTTPGQVDEFITPTIELQWVTNATLTFNYAFARKTSSNTDQLRVLSSIDCGKTWILRRNVSTAQLETANQRPAPFTPNGAAEWNEISIPLFQLLSAPGPIMIKFEFTNGGGNNFYLDNINIASILSQSELATGIATAQIYPNPGAGSPTLVVPGWNEAYQVRVTDLGGRLCAPEQEFTGGAQQTLNLEHLSSGVYFITITANGQSHTLRYIRS